MVSSAVVVSELALLESAQQTAAAWDEYVEACTRKPPARPYQIEAAYLRFYTSLTDMCQDADELADVKAGAGS